MINLILWLQNTISRIFALSSDVTGSCGFPEWHVSFALARLEKFQKTSSLPLNILVQIVSYNRQAIDLQQSYFFPLGNNVITNNEIHCFPWQTNISEVRPLTCEHLDEMLRNLDCFLFKVST